ncbi:MAG: DUF3108 domain-containing protein [Xanthobacteraceae bacterium]
MAPHRQIRHAMLIGAAALVLSLSDGACSLGMAQGKLDARYVVTLGGLAVGRGSWAVDIGDDHFSTTASGATAGLMRVFASGQGQSAARGTVSGGQLIPASYTSSISTDQKYDEVRMSLNAGSVKEFVAEPPNTPSPNRVPLTEAHRRGVSDPITAALLRVPGMGDLFVPQACQRKLAVFDGRMRYDLQLSFKRLERVRAEKGYQGTALVCGLQFIPIAGHMPDRAAIKYIAELRDIEVWAAPIAGTRVMAPYRVSFPTPIGTGVMQATQFLSVPHPSKTTATTQ